MTYAAQASVIYVKEKGRIRRGRERTILNHSSTTGATKHVVKRENANNVTRFGSYPCSRNCHGRKMAGRRGQRRNAAGSRTLRTSKRMSVAAAVSTRRRTG